VSNCCRKRAKETTFGFLSAGDENGWVPVSGN